MFDLGSEIRIFKKRNSGLEWWNAIDDSIWNPRSESSSRFMEDDQMCGTVFRFILVNGVFYLNLICPVRSSPLLCCTTSMFNKALLYAHVVTNVHNRTKTYYLSVLQQLFSNLWRLLGKNIFITYKYCHYNDNIVCDQQKRSRNEPLHCKGSFPG